jgi:hypothetical protein
MNVKVVVVLCLIVSVPVYAQAQSPSAAKLSKGDAEKVVTIINGDKAKTKAYCDMEKLAKEIEEAYKRKDGKTITESYQKIETLEKTLGPEYAALIDGLQDIAKDEELEAEFLSAVAALNKLCTK